MDEIKQSVKIALDQIQEFKNTLTDRVDKTIEGYRVHVAELEAP